MLETGLIYRKRENMNYGIFFNQAVATRLGLLITILSVNLIGKASTPLPSNITPNTKDWKLRKSQNGDSSMTITGAANKIITLKKTTARVNSYITSPVFSISPLQGQKIILRFDYKLTDYKNYATKPWHGACSQVRLYDNNGKMTISGVRTFTSNTAWKTVEGEVAIPKNAIKMQVFFGFLHSAGTISVRDIKIEKKNIM